MNIEFPKFDPEKSGEVADRIMTESNTKGILIGRLAIWAWLSDDAGNQAYTKDMDIAVSKRDFPAILAYLANKLYKTRQLPIGGVNVASKMERKDEEDAKRLLNHIERIDIDELRSMVKRFLGPLINAKLENMLREIGHPKARKKYDLS